MYSEVRLEAMPYEGLAVHKPKHHSNNHEERDLLDNNQFILIHEQPPF